MVALLLAGTGLHAVIAYSVSQRTKQIGVRMAIGAASHDIRHLIFREGMRPVTLVTAPAMLIAVALIAWQIPSRRALRIDPAVVLRHDGCVAGPHARHAGTRTGRRLEHAVGGV